MLNVVLEQSNKVSDMVEIVLGYLESPDSQQQASETSVTKLIGETEVIKFKGKTIKKRADNRYWTRYYSDGKQVAVYGKTQKECLNNLKAALGIEQKKRKEKNIYTYNNWLDEWIRIYKEPKLKAGTLYQTKNLIRRYIAEDIGKAELVKLTTFTLQQKLSSIDKPRQREHVFCLIKDSLTRAWKLKLIADNITTALEVQKAIRKESNALTLIEEQQFIAEAQKHKYGDIFLLCLYQGLRKGEAMVICREDIDFEKGTLNINKSMNDLNKIDTPKTAKSIRIMPLFKRTIDLLQKYKDLPNDCRIWNTAESNVQKYWSKIVEQLNFKGKYTIHSLRHTFATRCAEANIPAKQTQHWLGHATLEMTMNIYTHINKDFEQKNTAIFDTYFDT